MSKIVYVDMDGVLADFDRRKLEVFGTLDVLDEEMWPEIHKNHPDWFFTLPKFPDHDWFCAVLGAGYWDIDVAVLSAMPNPRRGNVYNCLWGKSQWVKKHCGWPAIFCVRSHKSTYATPDSILIDDLPQNIEDWRKKGGIGILHKSQKESIAELEQILGTRR